jgi:hypothetical protein
MARRRFGADLGYTLTLAMAIGLLAASCGKDGSPAAETPIPSPSASPTPATSYEELPTFGEGLIFSNVIGQRVARAIQLPAPLAVGQLRWWGTYDAPLRQASQARFEFELYDDAGGQPAASPIYAASVLASTAESGMTSGHFAGRPILRMT